MRTNTGPLTGPSDVHKVLEIPFPFDVRTPFQDQFGRWWITANKDVRAVLNNADTLIDLSLQTQVKRVGDALGKTYPHLQVLFNLVIFTNGEHLPARRSEANEVVRSLTNDLTSGVDFDTMAVVDPCHLTGAHEIDAVADVICPTLDAWRAKLLGITPAQSCAISGFVDEMMAVMSQGLAHGGPARLDGAAASVERSYRTALAVGGRDFRAADFVRLGVFFVAINSLRGFCANALDILARNQALQNRLRHDPNLLPEFVIEVERFSPALRFLAREIGVQEMRVGGVTLPLSARVVIDLGAACRDPLIWDKPDQFDMTRPRIPNLAFSEGAHRCLGVQATRRFVPRFLEHLLKTYRFSNGTTERQWGENWLLHSPTMLPLFFERV